MTLLHAPRVFPLPGSLPGSLPSVAALVVVVVIAGCDTSGSLDPSKTFEPVLQFEPFRTTVAGVFFDAASGQILGHDVTVRFAGEAGPLIRDFLQESVVGPVSVGGSVSFGLANTVRPTPERPIDLTVIASAPGYRTTSTRVEIRREGRQEFRLGMTPALSTDDRSTSGSVRSTNGRIDDYIELSIEELGQEWLLVALPASSRITSPEGSPLESRTTVGAAWVPPTRETLLRLPGGLDADLLDGGDEFGAGTMTVGAILEFTTPNLPGLILPDSAVVRARVSDVLRSPRTNAAPRPGDEIDVFEWRPTDGTWGRLAREEAMRQGDGVGVEFRIGSTGTFAVGYRTVPCTDAVVTLAGNAYGGSVTAYRGETGRSDGLRVWRFGAGQEFVTLSSPPSFWDGILEVRHGESVTTVPYSDLCAGNWAVELPNGPAPDAVSYSLAPVSCSGLLVNEVPNLSILSVPDATDGNRWLHAPYLVPEVRLARDGSGRVLDLTVSLKKPARRLVVTIDGQSWTYPDPPVGSIDISGMATEAGLCS